MNFPKFSPFCIAFLPVLLLCPKSALSQSLFLNDGESGTAFVAGAQFGEWGSSYGGSAGYSIRGRIDLRVAFAVMTGNGSGTGFGLTIEGHPIRNSRDQPFGLSLGLSAETDSYRLSGTGREESTLAPSVFGGVSYFIPAGEGVWILPMYEFRWIGRFLASKAGRESLREDLESTSLHTIGGSVVVEGGGKIRYFLSPSVAGSSEGWYLNVEIGILF